MSDKPILFSGPMVRALLAGTKTQTRRLLPSKVRHSYVAQDNRQQPYKLGMLAGMRYWNVSGAVGGRIMLEPDFLRLMPWQAGDRLYVREAWRTNFAIDHQPPRLLNRADGLFFEADQVGDVGVGDWGKFRQAMHMPRWASRLTLTVTDVRVERLQDSSEEDARAEGAGGYSVDEEGVHTDGFAANYRRVWEAINGPGSWDANPWVAAYTFTVQHGNIDQLPLAA